jgi:hypothetical protein
METMERRHRHKPVGVHPRTFCWLGDRSSNIRIHCGSSSCFCSSTANSSVSCASRSDSVYAAAHKIDDVRRRITINTIRYMNRCQMCIVQVDERMAQRENENTSWY